MLVIPDLILYGSLVLSAGGGTFFVMKRRKAKAAIPSPIDLLAGMAVQKLLVELPARRPHRHGGFYDHFEVELKSWQIKLIWRDDHGFEFRYLEHKGKNVALTPAARAQLEAGLRQYETLRKAREEADKRAADEHSALDIIGEIMS